MEGTNEMTDRSQWTLYLAGTVVFLLLCIIGGLAWYKRRMDRISDHIGGIPQGDVAALRAVINDQNDLTRQHVSNVVASIQHDTEITKLRMYDAAEELATSANEMRGQFRAVKDRVQWLIKVIDVLTDRVNAIFNVVFAPKPETQPPPKIPSKDDVA